MVKKNNPAVIIQARYNSKRFKGKVLSKINNISLLEILIKRLKKSNKISKIIVACTTNKDDKKIVKLCDKLKVSCYRGPEHNVLKRYYLAARKFKLKNIIRITSDCPLVDIKTLNNLILQFTQKNLDYASNTLNPTYPDGMDIEIFSFKVLKERFLSSKSKKEKEHVTTLISTSKKYKKYGLKLEENYSKLRLTVDTKYDLYVINKLLKYFNYNIHIDLDKIIKLYKKKKDFFERNSNQKRNINMDLNLGQKFWIRANEIIPGGTMLFSKNPDLLLPLKWPAYFSKSKGYNVWDLENNKYSDMFSMGIGTNSLGYCRKDIDNQVIKTLNKGNMTSLNSTEEIILAEKLISLHPWADMVRFTRSGGEANSVAIRIARASTQKDNVAVCGYHGWHDWYLSSNLNNSKNLNLHLMKNLPIDGVAKNLKNTTFPFEYNNFNQLENLVNKKNIGIIKMEVRRFEPPKNNFLKKVRNLANKKKIILIFDECTSGFREAYGGLHIKYNISPDIAIFGKALGNGYAINAIIGKKDVMEACKSTFISSTFWTERIGSTAAIKTLEIMKKLKSWEYIPKIGKYIKQKWASLSKAESVPIKIDGLNALPIFNFETKKNDHLTYKTYLTQEMLKKNILASNVIYISVAHDKKMIDKYFLSLEKIFKKIKQCENENLDINALLETRKCISGMRYK